FDFDPLELTYRALTRLCLSTPPTLFTTDRFANASSWSLEPPGQVQFEALKAQVREKWQHWRLERLGSDGNTEHSSNSMNGQKDSNGDTSKPLGHHEEEKVLKHVVEAYNHWKALPEKQRIEFWRLEVQRAFARQAEKSREAQASIGRLRQENEHLRAQVDRLSRIQLPRELLIKPPITIPMSNEIFRELN